MSCSPRVRNRVSCWLSGVPPHCESQPRLIENRARPVDRLLAPLPRTVVVEQYVSQALLLPRCSAVICHGGAGTVSRCLSQGVPLGLYASRADQFANAEQVARVGAGITLQPDQVSVKSISNAARQVLNDPSYAAVHARSTASVSAGPPKP
jgi:UDP:flavonoid glycosyltransferase YjiC (YdhE family)